MLAARLDEKIDDHPALAKLIEKLDAMSLELIYMARYNETHYNQAETGMASGHILDMQQQIWITRTAIHNMMERSAPGDVSIGSIRFFDRGFAGRSSSGANSVPIGFLAGRSSG
jgi:hypothetical protein